MAICITDEESAEQQRLKLMANIVFTAVYCRTASICDHYSHQPVSIPNGSRADIIVELKFHTARAKTDECKNVIRHAQFALQAFERLCEIDSEGTAKCWFSLQGAITAIALLAVHGLREKSA